VTYFTFELRIIRKDLSPVNIYVLKVQVGFRGKWRRGLVGAALCGSLADMPAWGQVNPPPQSTQQPPREVKPPRKASEQGFQTALLFGINVLPRITYNYKTLITLPNGQQLPYTGSQSAPGVTIFAGGSVTFPGVLRRITAGAHVDAGGLSSQSRAVVPENTLTPFSKQNLQNAVELQHPFGVGWHPALTSYVEHDIWRLSESKLRVGYQYWRQTGAYHGTFSPGVVGLGGYDVAMQYSSHMIRVSLNHSLYLGDLYSPDASQHSGTKSGFIRMLGVAAGSHKTIMAFFATGPIWAF